VVELVGRLTEYERDCEANQVEGNKVDLTDEPVLAHEDANDVREWAGDIFTIPGSPCLKLT